MSLTLEDEESYKVFELKGICGPKGRRDFYKVIHLLSGRAKNRTWQTIKMAPVTVTPWCYFCDYVVK